MDVLPTPVSLDSDSLSSEERERLADLREAALEKRERAVEVKQSVQLIRDRNNRATLAAADERDQQADERDATANARDRAASLESFLGDADYSPGYRSRMLAGLDRQDSKSDRTSAAEDRSTLTRDGRQWSELDDV